MTKLCLTANALRGLCWATKTTRQGLPFAVTVMGFTGRGLSTSWVVHWLGILSQSLARTQRECGSEHCPDFALPSFSPSNVLVSPLYTAPLAYSQALTAQTPCAPSPCLTDSEAGNLTLHSLKVTVLSAAQLRLPEDDRRAQGHHKLSSTRLYGRDDTHLSTWMASQASRPRTSKRSTTAPTNARARELFLAVCNKGGIGVYEQPPTAMSWLLDGMRPGWTLVTME